MIFLKHKPKHQMGLIIFDMLSLKKQSDYINVVSMRLPPGPTWQWIFSH